MTDFRERNLILEMLTVFAGPSYLGFGREIGNIVFVSQAWWHRPLVLARRQTSEFQVSPICLEFQAS